MNEIRLTLAVPEVNEILEALGQKPYGQVYQLIAKIQEQAADQLEAAGGEAGRIDTPAKAAE